MNVNCISQLLALCMCGHVSVLQATASTEQYQIADSSKYSLTIVDAETVDELQWGEVAVLERKIRNTGVEVIHIQNLWNTKCGCGGGATVNPPSLAAGQTAVFRIPYGTYEKKAGYNGETFAISTPSKQVVPVQGQVKTVIHKDIVMQPQNVDLGQIVMGSGRVTAHVDVVSKLPIDTNAIIVQPSAPYVICGIDPQVRPMKRSGDDVMPTRCTLRVDVDPNRAPQEMKESIDVTIGNTDGRARRFRIVVSGRTVPAIRTEPRNVFWGYVEPNTVIDKVIAVINETKKPIEITAVEFPKNVVGTWRVTQRTVGINDVALRIRISSIEKTVGKVPITITVRCGSNEVHKIECPCTYVGGSKSPTRRHE